MAAPRQDLLDGAQLPWDFLVGRDGPSQVERIAAEQRRVATASMASRRVDRFAFDRRPLARTGLEVLIVAATSSTATLSAAARHVTALTKGVADA